MRGKVVILPILVVGVVVLMILADSDLVQAAESAGGYLAGYEETDPRPTPVSWWSTIAYLVSLFAVFAIVIVLAYFATRAFGSKAMGKLAAQGGRIHLQLPLGPNRSACVVEVLGRVFLLGVTEHNITLLAEFESSDELAEFMVRNAGDDTMFSNQFGSLSDIVQKIPPIFRR